MERRLYSLRGNDQKLDGGAMFGNVPKALWERWAPADDQNRIDLASRALLVHEGRRLVLLEAGIGAWAPPALRERYGIQQETNRLLTSLDALGLTHADVSVVVLSHLHFDHAGGLLTDWVADQPPELLFPNATFLVSQRQWDRACAPHARDKASYLPALVDLLGSSGRLELVDGETHRVTGPGYRFHLSDGHSPGMLLTEIEGELGPLLFAADLIPGRAWVHGSVSMGYDRFPELLLDEKTALLARLALSQGRIFFTHDPSAALCHVTRDDQGRFGSANVKTSVRGQLA